MQSLSVFTKGHTCYLCFSPNSFPRQCVDLLHLPPQLQPDSDPDGGALLPQNPVPLCFLEHHTDIHPAGCVSACGLLCLGLLLHPGNQRSRRRRQCGLRMEMWGGEGCIRDGRAEESWVRGGGRERRRRACKAAKLTELEVTHELFLAKWRVKVSVWTQT